MTTDNWTSCKKDPFISVTCHFVDEEWKLRSFLLDVFYFPHPHGGSFCLEALHDVCEEYEIVDKIKSITTDNAGNMVLFGEMFESSQRGLVHVRCANHILNLVVQEGIRDHFLFDLLLNRLQQLQITWFLKNKPLFQLSWMRTGI
ncbi:unnamed protein product [Brachionus calyciflorus]|uniref:Uncharacterized protein n=1 Tax=Brachionus calyciflorus TaxID=104777 RepID=A0A814S4U1_9BILA|nr:unnamed protein product [Brachionus calyciflorus]